MRNLLATIILTASLLPSVALAASWADSVGTGANFTNTNTVNQTPGANLSSQSTGVPGSVSGYTPLEPLTAYNGGKYANFADYLGTIYKLAITVGALIAVVMLVTGGVRYMLSESFTDIDKAKKRIINALWGLTILIGSFLILYTINPNLLTFNLLLPNVNQTASQFNIPTGDNASTNANFRNGSIVTPLQYNNQNANDVSTAKAVSNFIMQCQRTGGAVIKVPGTEANTTAETCMPTAGFY